MIKAIIIGLLLSVAVNADITSFQGGASSLNMEFFEPGNQSIYIVITDANECIDTGRSTSVLFSGSAIITEDGRADASLITDVSGSMQRQVGGTAYGVQRDCDDPNLLNSNTRRIDMAKCLDIEFTSTVVDNTTNDTRLTLVRYNERGIRAPDLTNDETLLIDTINAYVPGGYTCISCGIRDSIDELTGTNSDPTALKTIVLMTDGQANRCYPPVDNCGTGAGEQQARDFAYDSDDPLSAIRNGIVIHTIAFGGNAREALLQDIASNTGGLFYTSSDPVALQNIYNEIANLIITGSYPTPSVDLGGDGSNDYDPGIPLTGDDIWDDSVLITALNVSTSTCFTPPCIMEWIVYSSSIGNITISDLNIATGPCGIPAFCGNSIREMPEECDDGPLNNDTIPDACRLNCMNAGCNDGVIDTGEVCDDGLLNSDTEPDACRTNCVEAFCGDDVIDTTEVCDNGTLNNDVNPHACRTGCIDAYCGDTVIDDLFGEECDDGRNGVTDDGCDDDCLLTTDCGNGIIEGIEACDDGVLNSNIIPDTCRLNCQLPRCSDHIVDSTEQCDDGNNNNGDGCSATCTEESGTGGRCGDNVRQSDLGEECDDGEDGSNICTPWCEFTECGDGIRQRPNADGEVEECDDGNSDEDDFCDEFCVKQCLEQQLETVENVAFETIDFFNDYAAMRNTWRLQPLTNNVIGADFVRVAFPVSCFGTCAQITPFLDWSDETPDNVNITLFNTLGDDVTFCYNFSVENVPDYDLLEAEETRLLVPDQRFISNYYENPVTGNTDQWGPYTITVKIWEKR